MTNATSRRTRRVAAIGALAALVGAASALAQNDQPGPVDTKQVVDEPVERTATDERAQVVTIVFDFDSGRVRSAEVESSEVVQGGAPNVFARAGGDWIIRADDGEAYEFDSTNPGWREVEADNENGFEWIAVTGTVEWPLVLPLSIRGRELERITTLEIIDTVTGELVTSLEL
jgi:hypothetical protein